ncbi:MAG: DUF4956 domain-containing protein [Oscillospiraceae bacterium]|nr:DUF4956 domain-containing protein [Oscillospiraceae bacterium]
MSVSVFLICLLGALVLGVLTALVFSFRTEHSGNLPFALVLVPPIVTLVIMMVNGNIGAGLGVAGAFSLIRFRSAPGTARELSGLFTGTAIGLACGMGYVGIAALFFLVVALTVIALTLLRFGEKSRSYRHLRITIPENLDYDGLFDDLFEKYTAEHELHKVKTTNMGTLYELSYHIHIKGSDVPKEFLDELRCRNGNLNIVCGRESDKDML